MNGLFFAQKFPYTEKSKNILKEINVDFDEISEQAMKRAALLILKANSNKEYEVDLSSNSRELLKNEIVAFPIAKLLISTMQIPNLFEKFSLIIAKKTFTYLVEDDDAKEICLELADDFKLKYDLSDIEFISIDLIDYLNNYFIFSESKLINKKIIGGKVYLNVNDFARFLSEKAYKKVFDSLPISKENIPKKFLKLSKNIEGQLSNIQQKHFDEKIIGKVTPNYFPPSIKRIYENGLAGQKINHYERLTIGGFLRQVGMTPEQIIQFFSKAPNYKKQLTEYHVKRIFESELSAPGYAKMNEYGIIIEQEEKKFKHPLQYYKSKMKINNKLKNKKIEK